MSVSISAQFTQRWTRWTAFKGKLIAKGGILQYESVVDPARYLLFFYDEQDVHLCEIMTGVVPDGVANDPVDPYVQATNDADKADFEASYKPNANLKNVSRTADGRVRVAVEKSLQTRTNFYVHNFCDPTTWYSQAVRVVNETSTATLLQSTVTLAHTNVIDLAHAKVTLEDALRDGSGNSYKVAVTVNGVAKTERVWPATSGGDYTVNYAAGTVTFASLSLGDVVAVTYFYANGSRFTIAPAAGKKITVTHAKVSFSLTDVVMNDTIMFEVWGIADFFLTAGQMAAMGIPAGVGYKVLLQPFVYKTLVDFVADAHEIDVSIPAIGTGARASPAVCNFDWDYVAATQFHSTSGMEIRIYLQNNVAMGGTMTRTTFYCVSESEP